MYRRYHSRSIALLYCFNFFKSLQFFGAVAVPFFLHRCGLDYTGMFTLEMIFSVSLFLLEIPTGIVADIYGRKISLISGSVIFGISFAMFGLFNSYPVFVLAEIICALGMTLLSGADRALLYEIVTSEPGEHESSSSFARYDAFGTAGILLSLPCGSVLAGSGLAEYRLAMSLTFIISGISIAFASIFLIPVQEPPRVRDKQNFMLQGYAGVKTILTDTRIRAISINYAVIASMTFFMFWFYQSLLDREGLSIKWNGITGAGFNLLAIIFLFNTGRIEKFFGLKRTIFLTSFLSGCFYIAAGLVPGIVMSLWAIYVITLMRALRAPLLSDLLNQSISSGNRATVLSGVSMMERIITAVLYPVVGILADYSLNYVFLLLGSIIIIFTLYKPADKNVFSRINK